jgi:NADH:ubiquinone oxidoreductase subunit 6 (subunit J)
MGYLIAGGLFILWCFMSAREEDVAAARQRMKRYEPACVVVTLLIVALLAWDFMPWAGD